MGAIQTEGFISSLSKGRLGGIYGIGMSVHFAVCDDPKSPSIPLFQRGKKTSSCFHISLNRTDEALKVDRNSAIGYYSPSFYAKRCFQNTLLQAPSNLLARMAELVDALGSGPSAGNGVEVRVLFRAPKGKNRFGGFFSSSEKQSPAALRRETGVSRFKLL